MAKIKKLKQNNEDLYPITHEDAVFDSDGVNIGTKINNIEDNMLDLVDIGGNIGSIDNGIMDKINELEDKITNYDFVNVKELGMVGDGITDDTQALKNILSNYHNLFFPEGVYIINETIELDKYTNMIGTGTISNWGVDPKTILKGVHDDYIFSCSWNKQNNFKNLSFEGYGIKGICSSIVDKCSFNGHVGLHDLRATVVSMCTIYECDDAGLDMMTDCKVLNSFIWGNNIGINLYYSNDNIILGNKIEWNNLGVKYEKSVYNLLQDNIIDRNTTYGVEAVDGTYLAIKNNKFERNLNRHMKLTMYGASIIGNEFLSKNEEDDQSGEVLPKSAIYLKSVGGSIIVNNIVDCEKMFDSNYDDIESTTIRNNIINGINTENWFEICSDISIESGSNASGIKTWDDLDFLNGNGWDIEIKSVKLSVDYETYCITSTRDHEFVVYYDNMNGITYEISNKTNVEHTYSIRVLLEQTRFNKY